MLVGGIVVSPDQEDVTDVGPIYEALESRDFSAVIEVCQVSSITFLSRTVKQYSLNRSIQKYVLVTLITLF